jgi:uncharacterized membrane protein
MGTELFPLTNEAVILGLLMLILAFVFQTSASSQPFWKKFYTYVPPLLLCYFLPSLLTTTGLVNLEPEGQPPAQLEHVAFNYLLPASLVLLTLSIDLKGVYQLGPKAVIMFLTGTAGIMIGGPLSLLIMGSVWPEAVAPVAGEPVWRGLTTVAGSWIGGGANQAAMKEVFNVQSDLFSAMVTVDIIVANVWMAFLLYGAGRSERLDRRLKADSGAITALRQKVEQYRASIERIPRLPDLIKVLAVGFGITALGHLIANWVAPAIGAHYPDLKRFNLDSSFFWLMILVTTAGIIISFTRLRRLEGVGASRIGSGFIYILVATIGLKMDILAIFDNPELFLLGFIWMATHAGLLILVAWLIRAPFFFLAVGSQANVGGAASAPVVAAAFNPSLAPVGVLIAVLGYALGTYCAYLTGLIMQAVAG